ncbi:uncharacterized protein LOC141889311 [Acropora palmata]|uniref:uncharacterized protein LOC141889311 n=1 Tax=Acropora palmata TaxID=6131 RepID=UPI003DA08EC7
MNHDKYTERFRKKRTYAKADPKEVYDWVGSSNRMPLYFTIQRGSTVVKHTERLQSNEVLDISERDEDEMKVTLNNSEVSFLGQFQDSKEGLSETINGKPCNLATLTTF